MRNEWFSRLKLSESGTTAAKLHVDRILPANAVEQG